jgi:dihydrolipoamide dehydrogenase
MSETFDLLVIGGGPAGYVAAIRASQLGLQTACVEKESALGGTCLRVGCIPSKALLESSEWVVQARKHFQNHGITFTDLQVDLAQMMERKDKVVNGLTRGIDGLLKKNKITRFLGHAKIQGPGKVEVVSGNNSQVIQAKSVLIATGSQPSSLPGIDLDGDRIGTSTEALAYPEVPSHLVVIGAGYIGLELGSVWARLGAKVTVVEYLNRILPGMDDEIADEAKKLFTRQGLDFRLEHRVLSVKTEGNQAVVHCEDRDPLTADRVLVAVGRKPNTENLGLDSVGIQTDRQGRIPVNDRFETEIPGFYAIGDVIRGPMLAHKAEEEGVACAEFLAGKVGHVDYNCIPGVCYTHPEIACVGQTEEQLKEAGIEYRKGVFPFKANGRAQALGDTDGKVKVLADAATDRILGVHIIGPRAGDLIAEAATAMTFGASAEDIARASHAHPTLAEVLKEAALAVDGRALHA